MLILERRVHREVTLEEANAKATELNVMFMRSEGVV